MATPKMDLFAHPHQEQRQALCELSKGFSLQEKLEIEELESLVDKLQNTIDVIKDHSHSENMLISPLLNAKGLQTENWLKSEHENIERQLDEIEALISKIRTLDADKQLNFSAKIYSAVNRLIGHYFLHMNQEEQQIMPLLWHHCTAEEIMGIIVAHKAYKEPDVAQAMLPPILEKMTTAEKKDMFTSIKIHAPKEAYKASIIFQDAADDLKVSHG